MYCKMSGSERSIFGVLETNPSIHLDAVVAKRKQSRDSPVAKQLRVHPSFNLQ